MRTLLEATWDLCGHVRISSGPSGNSSGAHRLLSRSRQTPARKRCRAELGTFIKGLGGAGGTSKGGSHCFRPAKFIGGSRRRNASFSGHRDLEGGWIQKIVQNVVFSAIRI